MICKTNNRWAGTVSEEHYSKNTRPIPPDLWPLLPPSLVLMLWATWVYFVASYVVHFYFIAFTFSFIQIHSVCLYHWNFFISYLASWYSSNKKLNFVAWVSLALTYGCMFWYPLTSLSQHLPTSTLTSRSRPLPPGETGEGEGQGEGELMSTLVSACWIWGQGWSHHLKGTTTNLYSSLCYNTNPLLAY